MARYKRFVPGLDVLTAARQRMDQLYATNDTVLVSFSGGKDSLVCLHLAREAAEKAGKLPVEVVFVDEELIPDNVIELVNYYRQQDWVRMRWYCVPMKLSKFILGKTVEFVGWDPKRPSVRPRPDFPEVIFAPEGDDTAYALEHMTPLITKDYPGKIAQVIGLRAQESYKRYRGLVTKLTDNWIAEFASQEMRGLALCYPIYDWSQDDVIKWLHEREIAWPVQYNMQYLAGMGLRVSTPLHPESAKRFHFWRAVDPSFYERIITIFPEMSLQERYWKEYAPGGEDNADSYANDGFDGCLRYIREHYTEPEKAKLAMEGYQQVTRGALKKQDWATPEALLGWLRGGSVHVPPRVNLASSKSKGKKAKPAPAAPEHVCGLMGFGRGPDGLNDRCPACEAAATQRQETTS